MSIMAALVVAAVAGCGGGSSDACQPSDAGIGFSLCGTVDGQPLSYVPPSLQFSSRSQVPLGLGAAGPDGAWFDLRGPGAWTDGDTHAISSWFFRPQWGWTNDGVWLCGQGGTVINHSSHEFEGTLRQPAILPACGRQGGPESLHVEVNAGITAFDDGGGCLIGFKANDMRVTLLAYACPQPGLSLPIDGLRMFAFTEATDATACIGAGATVTWVDDGTSAAHLVVDIPSLSVPEACAPTVSGELRMKLAWYPTPSP